MLGAILVVAFGLRLGWAWHALQHVPTTWVTAGDQYSYWYYADQIARGHGYVSYTVHRATAYYPIGYPALLAGVFFVVRGVPQGHAVAILHALLGTGAVALGFVIARRIGGTTTGLLAAAITAVFPNLVLDAGTFSIEAAFVFFALLAIAAAVCVDWRNDRPPPWWRIVLFGLALGASAIVRPFSLPFLAGYLLAFLLAGWGWRAAAMAGGILVVTVGLLLVPWTVRNEVRLHAFVPFSTNLGDTLCLDRSVHATGGFSWAAHDGCAAPDLGEVERNRQNTRLAIHFVTHHPTLELRLVGRRFTKMMAGDHSALDEAEHGGADPLMAAGTRRAVVRVADVWFYAVAALSLPGLFVLLRGWRARPERAVVVVAMVTLLGIPLVLWGTPRFHVPLLPLLAVSAAAGVEVLVRQAAAPWKAASPKVKMPPSPATIQ